MTSTNTPDDDPVLREALKRCSPATYYAACKFRAAGEPEHLATVVHGVVERFVERELRGKLQAPPAEAGGLRLRQDLGLDSLTMMEIVMIAEEVLGITISNDELTQFETLDDVQSFIKRKVIPESAPSRHDESPVETWNVAAVSQQVREIENRTAVIPRPFVDQHPEHA